VHGDKLGRILGFPTANIEIDSRFKLIPADGIYAVTADHEHRSYKGMMYIGNRPAVAGTRQGLEVNLFDFDRDIYGDDITVHFHDRIREDSMFNDLEDLKRQLVHDKQEALRRLGHINLKQ
jgi:riboflavin kinase/FMN adenylyltransferase